MGQPKGGPRIFTTEDRFIAEEVINGAQDLIPGTHPQPPTPIGQFIRYSRLSHSAHAFFFVSPEGDEHGLDIFEAV